MICAEPTLQGSWGRDRLLIKMVTLLVRPGDAQALKVSITAAFANLDIDIKPATDGQAPTNVLGTPSLCLNTLDSLSLTEPNAAALYVLGSDSALAPADSAAAAAVDHWLQWEAGQLRAAVFAGGDAAAAALAELDAQLSKGGPFLAGNSITLADVAVYCTLLPLREQAAVALPAAVAAFMDKLAAEAAVKAGTDALLSGAPAGALLARFEADAAAFQARQPKLPKKGQRNILVTSALPYVNNVPHLGNIIGCVLSADCYARYARSRGYNAIFMCGTDEYGTATETKALEEGLSCQEICDKYHAVHKAVYEWFGCSFDKFGRTPTRAQTEICQGLFEDLWQAGNISEQVMEQLYSEAAGKFLADRFVSGTCPKCGYEDARGDQCDKCGGLMNPTDLLNPRCKLTGTKPVIRSTKHLFLDLPQLSDKLQAYIDTTSQLGGWSANCVQVTSAWMRDGLKQRCITRDLKWGIPVPLEGYRDKVFYVWFDAPVGYISITANYTDQWQQWWQSPEDVELVQFMGKDNVPFHTVIFPASLLGSGRPWTMMKNISVTEYLNYEGGKFSKSRGTGVFGTDAVETGIPVEVWRYYLLANRPEAQDTDFKWADLQARNNNELLKNLGNFINRALVFVAKFFDSKVPAATTKGQEAADGLGAAVAAKVQEYVTAMEKMKLRDGIRLAMAVSAEGNKFITETEPFRVVKTDPEHAATLVAAGVGVVRLLAALISPYMPTLTAKILEQLALPPSAAALTDELAAAAAKPQALIPGGHQIGKPAPLITEIKDEVVEGLRARFGGNQTEDAAAAAAAAGQKSGPGKKGAAAAAAAGKGSSGSKGGGKKQAEPEGPVDISRIDIRVGFITKAWRHPDADSLYVEEIDLGEPTGPRTVVSGLVRHIPEAAMQQRRVAVVANLKPAAMRGITSQAMVLAATHPDSGKVELLEPPAAAAIGERVTVEGFSQQPDEQLNPKKKVFEQVQPDLLTSAELVACYKGVPLMTSAGPVRVPSVAGASIK
ncbi:tRNA synthetases class I (M)-domain-containing protein [Scenedesmus sp. NREL 46B-D3]|nr:tRNA synthetases class I (M)-domain-containing protein [Scenedesmus sp. NREL 46B-D3]